jgi:D-glycero-beta-D-manno-heptose-7-phosphate kinase
MNLPDFSRARVLVVGDVMLDRYWFGDVNRISPEAPVPVVHVTRVEQRPGAAANVARGVAALGAQARLLAVIGDDEAGTALAELLTQASVSANLHRDAALETTVKLRVIGRQQQLIRLDFERVPSHAVLANKLADFERMLADADIVVLSDYAKGGLTNAREMIALARARGVAVIVDPKGDDYDAYRGASLLTPNRGELRAMVGSWRNDDELRSKAQALRERLALECLLVTRSEEGMTLYRSGAVLHVPAQAREVFDVTGAGDTVVAALAVMRAAGADWEDAVRAANLAAGIVVAKLGTAVVTRAELTAAGDA